MGSLRDVWEAHRGRSAMKLDHYIDAQDRHLARFRDRPVHLVEIGVLFGGSLQIWKSYLGAQAHITGIDVNDAATQAGEDRIEIVIGDQGDREFLREFAASHPIDILIDDGGHRVEQQVATFEELFPHIAPDGVYICEDTITSYWPDFGSASFVEWMGDRVDELHAWDEPTAFTRSAASVHFYPSLIVVEKGQVGGPVWIKNDGTGVVREPFTRG